jgi:glutamate/tyrosine decarboxylase-like PLP-dependent enzyme
LKLETKSLEVLGEALETLEAGFAELPALDPEADLPRLREVLREVAGKMRDNFPYFHPYYAGQMLKPPHPVARLAYMLALWINPNNHAFDGGRASSFMEKEAVAEIARLFGWKTFLGHLTSGGTMANLEALWIAGRMNPGKKILASEQAHYTHQRISAVLGLSFESVPCDAKARMDIESLVRVLERGEVGTVVATLGTTGTGAVDPLLEILELRDRYGFRLHVDAAYGGYFILADNLDAQVRRAFDGLTLADSIVVDPHKHGLQPYGCGCVLYRDPAVGRFYKHDSPYTYFTSSELHLGEISLECSRAGASAVALWATQKMLPYLPGGEFARSLGRCRQAALDLFARMSGDRRFRMIFPPELDILIWAPRGRKASEISARSERFFSAAAADNLHLAKFRYPASLLRDVWKDAVWDQPEVVCLRSCLMKPEHRDWADPIWAILDRAAERAE